MKIDYYTLMSVNKLFGYSILPSAVPTPGSIIEPMAPPAAVPIRAPPNKPFLDLSLHRSNLSFLAYNSYNKINFQHFCFQIESRRLFFCTSSCFSDFDFWFFTLNSENFFSIQFPRSCAIVVENSMPPSFGALSNYK